MKIDTIEDCPTTPVFQRRLPPIYRGHQLITPNAGNPGDFPPLVIPVNTETRETPEVIESNNNSELPPPQFDEFSNRKERNSSRIHLPKEDPVFEGNFLQTKDNFVKK